MYRHHVAQETAGGRGETEERSLSSPLEPSQHINDSRRALSSSTSRQQQQPQQQQYHRRQRLGLVSSAVPLPPRPSTVPIGFGASAAASLLGGRGGTSTSAERRTFPLGGNDPRGSSRIRRLQQQQQGAEETSSSLVTVCNIRSTSNINNKARLTAEGVTHGRSSQPPPRVGSSSVPSPLPREGSLMAIASSPPIHLPRGSGFLKEEQQQGEQRQHDDDDYYYDDMNGNSYRRNSPPIPPIMGTTNNAGCKQITLIHNNHHTDNTNNNNANNSQNTFYSLEHEGGLKRPHTTPATSMCLTSAGSRQQRRGIAFGGVHAAWGGNNTSPNNTRSTHDREESSSSLLLIETDANSLTTTTGCRGSLTQFSSSPSSSSAAAAAYVHQRYSKILTEDRERHRVLLDKACQRADRAEQMLEVARRELERLRGEEAAADGYFQNNKRRNEEKESWGRMAFVAERIIQQQNRLLEAEAEKRIAIIADERGAFLDLLRPLLRHRHHCNPSVYRTTTTPSPTSCGPVSPSATPTPSSPSPPTATVITVRDSHIIRLLKATQERLASLEDVMASMPIVVREYALAEDAKRRGNTATTTATSTTIDHWYLKLSALATARYEIIPQTAPSSSSSAAPIAKRSGDTNNNNNNDNALVDASSIAGQVEERGCPSRSVRAETSTRRGHSTFGDGKTEKKKKANSSSAKKKLSTDSAA